MTDSHDIVVIPPEDEPSKDEAEFAKDEVSKRPIWPFALVGGALLGFGLAFGASWYLRPAPYDPSPLLAQIERLESDVSDLKARPEPTVPEVDLGPLTRRIDALEARPVLEPVDEALVERMEAIQANGFELPEMPDWPEPADLAPIDARLSALDAAVDTLEATVDALEARPPVVAPPVAAASPETMSVEAAHIVDPDTLPRFPARTLREGIAQTGGSGLLRRTFSRHVRVRGQDDPERLIDLIEDDLAAGRAQAALAKFDRLPQPVQSLARAWRADMEAALP